MVELKEPEPSRQALMLYNKGMDAFNKGNIDYAVTLFISAVKDSPGFVKARNILRLAEFKKFQSKFEIVKKIITFITTLPLQISMSVELQKKNWRGVMSKAEDILKHNPKNVSVLMQLANAAEMSEEDGMILTAIDSYEKARKIKPKNAVVLKTLARIYRAIGDLDRARACFEEILRYYPTDKDINKGLKDLAALGTIARGGLDDTSTYRTKIRDGEKAEILEKEAKMVKTEEDIELLIANAEKQLQMQPESINIHRKLSDLYVENEEFDKAINMLEAAARLDKGDISIKREIANVTIKRFDKEIRDIENKLLKTPDSGELQFELKRIKNNKNSFILKDLSEKVAQYPNDMTLRYDLGSIYLKLGEYDKAVAEFQLAVRNPQRRTRAMNFLGLCFQAKKMYDMAINQFQKAIQSLKEMDALKKEVIYNLGTTYEKMQDWDKAIEHFKQIYEVDINYKNISQKIEHAYKEKSSDKK
ncbi:tetratricopeptide repeat protein [bacterium]|jgi:tetratricopeptide (TPR) repeat protein|nr:tetratricopeptide repeat protein [bacterium]